MRICMIGNATAVHLQRWAGAYASLGHTVDILSIRSAEVRGATVHTMAVGPPNSPGAFWTLLSYLRLAVGARRRVRSLGPDVVNPHFVTTSGVIARIAGIHPIVLTAWGSDVIPPDGVGLPGPLRWLNAWALRGADRVTAASRYLAGWVERAGGADVDLIPFGVDTDRFRPAEEPTPGPFTVGAVKSLQAKYGTRYLIEAIAVLVRSVPSVRLLLAGEGPERSRLEALASQLGIARRVEFLGHVAHDEVPALMQEFDVLVNPTVVPEAFGVVVLEASASGLPVVATAVGGVPEVCLDEVTGLLVAPRDPAALAAALSALAVDEDRRASLGRAGRTFVAERFGWSAGIAAMMTVIEASRLTR